MFAEAGAVVAAGVVTTYVATKALEFVPVLGQLASGVISGSVSAVLGLLWWWACDSAYRRGMSVATVLREATQPSFSS